MGCISNGWGRFLVAELPSGSIVLFHHSWIFLLSENDDNHTLAQARPSKHPVHSRPVTHFVLILELAKSTSQHEHLLLWLLRLLLWQLARLERGLSRLCILPRSLRTSLLRQVTMKNDLLVVLEWAIHQVLYLIRESGRRVVPSVEDVSSFKIVVCR